MKHTRPRAASLVATLALIAASTTAAGVVATAGPAQPAAAASGSCPWVGSSAPISQRVSQLLAAMTVAQKVTVLTGASGSSYVGFTPAIGALCIPAMNLEDGPARVGDGMGGVTQLPAPVDVAATVTMPWLSSVAGVFEAWYPGQQDGTAIAALLFGSADPSGHLTVTFPASLAQVPAATAAQWPGQNGTVQYSEGIDVGYRWYDTQGLCPLFPFGYGLSYTSFSFSNLNITTLPKGVRPRLAPR